MGPPRVEALELPVEVLAVEVDEGGREGLVEGIETEHPPVGSEGMGHVAPDVVVLTLEIPRTLFFQKWERAMSAAGVA
jgi:hypothetical protein